jgi:hypothetical protein
LHDKELEALKLCQKCRQSIDTLRAHRRSADKEHAERVKKIQAADDAISGWHRRGDLELPGFEGVQFPPETMALIYDPLRGL